MRDYLELGKPRIALMVALTAFLGHWFAGGQAGAVLAWMVLGTTLTACSAAALNQLFEIGPDGLMSRTKNRPLPAGRLAPPQAAAFAMATGVLGLAALYGRVNALAGHLAAFTIAAYALAYTPLKRVTPQSTWVGALAGATPPLIGWAAARGSLAVGAWLLFAIQFIWQIPHFLALFWIYREEYARAGFKVMPVVDPVGTGTAIQIAFHSLALLIASVMPAFLGLASPRFAALALAAGIPFLCVGLRASWTMTVPDARRLFRASLAYLPAIFGLLAWG
ncbi:MAG TPA: heme o synthase [Elusimicrobiota bacterium]|nr:heme o synthase [Elusimicrobiota bacterium]